MATTFQQQSQLRKLIYLGSILALFTAALFFRKFMVEKRADSLALREQNLGEVQLTDSAIRLSLTGSRGFATTMFWWQAIEKQKRHEWNKLEMLVRSVIKLQPHFITPWLFQSWNLAYNVSVEMDSRKDRYFYIARGIELLGEGERQNRAQVRDPATGQPLELPHPDLCFNLGFYTQHKIGLSDDQETFRCLFQLSGMDPKERNPEDMRTRDGGVDLAKFEQFCQKHPMLVRRLRDKLVCQKPSDVLDFLALNWRVPSRYVEQSAQARADLQESRLKPAWEQFPLLPPPFGLQEVSSELATLDDDFDNFAASRAWFRYATSAMPEPNATPNDGVRSFDRGRYRMPRYITHLIFRHYPARAQSFVAERFAQEGWFDEGWKITEWFPDDRFRDGSEAVVGKGRGNWSQDAWARAHQMWQDHGTENGLYLGELREDNLRNLAQKYRDANAEEARTQIPFDMPAHVRGTDMETAWEAHQQLHWYEHNRNMCNFPHFFHKSLVEAQPEAAKARKAFFKAARLYKTEADASGALRIYESPDALAAWRELLLRHENFQLDSTVQEDTYEIQLDYLDIVRQRRGNPYRMLLLLQDYLTQQSGRLLPTPWTPPYFYLADVPLGLVGPFDGVTKSGRPILDADTIARVNSRQLPSGGGQPAEGALAPTKLTPPVMQPADNPPSGK